MRPRPQPDNSARGRYSNLSRSVLLYEGLVEHLLEARVTGVRRVVTKHIEQARPKVAGHRRTVLVLHVRHRLLIRRSETGVGLTLLGREFARAIVGPRNPSSSYR